MTTPAGVTSYSYDQAARLVGISDASNGSFAFGYYPSDWLSSQSTGTLFNSAYFYDQDGALYSVQNTTPTNPPTTLSTFGFGRNSLGLRTEQDSFYSSQAGYGGTANYSYDTLNRLISEANTANGGFSNGYQYDAAGNPTTFRSGDPTAGAGYTADNQNALGLFHYDGEGNPTTYRGISGQTFDAEDRPLTLATNAGSVANGWRVDGLRGWKNGANGLVNYLYAGGVPVCEMTGSNVIASNTWGPNGLLARKTTNPTTGVSAGTYYAWDGLGNAAQTLSSSGAVTNTFCYDAYGARTSTSATTDPYSGFGGQWGYQTEAETGLTLCGARYYDSFTGRWLTRDPIGYEGGLNLYGYVGGNPLSGIDPDGLDSMPRGMPDAIDSGTGLLYWGGPSACPSPSNKQRKAKPNGRLTPGDPAPIVKAIAGAGIAALAYSALSVSPTVMSIGSWGYAEERSLQQAIQYLQEAQQIRNAAMAAGQTPPNLDPPFWSTGGHWGEAYTNDKGYLPGTPGAGGYSIYDLPRIGGEIDRGARRLVINDTTGEMYYTRNHYRPSLTKKGNVIPAFFQIK